MQEEERKRREAQKADLERIRKEVDRKEAEEMLRLKLVKEEEKKKQREEEHRKAEERNKESAERQEVHTQEATSRKTAFAAHKLILEQRVLKALEDSKQENTVTKRRSSSFERPTESFIQDEPDLKAEDNADDVFPSAGVKLRKANFEKTGARKDSKEELRKKRYSLNLEQSRRLVTSPEDAALRNKHPGSVGKKYYADDVFAGKGAQAQLEREEELLKRVGYKSQSNESKLAKAKSLGDLSLKKGQNDDRSPQHVLRKVSFNSDDIDSADGIPAFSDSRIQRELEDQRMREEVVKKEVTEREKRHRLEEEKKKATELAAGKKETSLNEIKKNPLPNKIQVKKPSSNRDSLTHSMAAHWETVLQSQDGSEVKGQKERKTSRIEIEKEEERRREEELQKERERVLLEKRQKEEQKKSEKQRKLEEEIERKRREKEEKEKRQQRTLAMKSLFEKMGKK
ncbi:hypothetical protein OS493_008616 [Desmophyllum pertusum]|uniref:Uncharacterized protein n=1 Tax=Desmophyllum pertusum TaxID=174260 RepID=A0A9W9ZRD2_9CNID|nr:hypothetical protein OS493_008616 [Desmophyllum pertusum]